MREHLYAVRYLHKTTNLIKISMFYDYFRACIFFEKQMAGEIWFKIRNEWQRIAWGPGKSYR
jgi:hypothetical protein